MPKVSVVVPAYNQAGYLAKAIQSVLDQTYADFEILIIDDGSTDQTREVTEAFLDERIRYIYQENRGLSAARNTGIVHSTGTFISYLDADDQFMPEKFALLVSLLEKNPHFGFAAGQAIPVDEDNRPVGEIFDVPLPSDSCNWLLGNPLHVGSVLIQKAWQVKVGFFDENLRSYEDWDMWLRLARAGCQMIWLPKPVSLYRFHQQQMTRIGRQMTEATFAVLDKHFADPTLVESWNALHDQAYSNAHLRAAMQAYHTGEYTTAQSHMLDACRLNYNLVAGDADELARRLAAFACSPKNPDPIQFLENIYNHLPVELDVLRRRRDKDIGQVAIEAGFRYYHSGEHGSARTIIMRAIRYQPGLLKNIGIWSVLSRTFLHAPGDPRKAIPDPSSHIG